MLTPSTRTARTPKQALGGRLPKRRDDSGLTTLEWLLIVAAVAGLAALAVVLVTNVVGSTGEQIEGQGARRTAAIFAAQSIMDEANRDATDQPARANTWEEWDDYYQDKCLRLRLTYGDAGITPSAVFDIVGVAAANTADTVQAANVVTADATANDTVVTVGGNARAHCSIS